jgi:hypothetical protein
VASGCDTAARAADATFLRMRSVMSAPSASGWARTRALCRPIMSASSSSPNTIAGGRAHKTAATSARTSSIATSGTVA